VNPSGGAGWDEPPLDIQIPDDARELDRDVLAYHRELRARRRRNRLRRLAGPLARHGTIMPLLASILAVCLVAGAMLSVATFSPATAPAERTHPPASTSASATPRPTPTARPGTAQSAATQAGTAKAATTQAQSSGTGRATRSATPSAPAARPHPSGTVSASTP
jgi:cytoskeletal protein RodZ